MSGEERTGATSTLTGSGIASATEIASPSSDARAAQAAAGRVAVERLSAQQDAKAGYTWRSFAGEPFVNEGRPGEQTIAPEDVEQGEIGDCDLLASLMAVAQSEPALIQAMISRVDPDQFDVTLMVRDKRGRKAPQIVRVTAEFPSLQGVQHHAISKEQIDGRPELWPLLIEKAYMALRGGYAAVEGEGLRVRGGRLLDEAGLDYLVDGETTRKAANDQPVEQHLADIEKALTDERPVVVGLLRQRGDDAEADRYFVPVGAHRYAPSRIDRSAGVISLRDPRGADTNAVMPFAVFGRLLFDVIIANGR